MWSAFDGYSWLGFDALVPVIFNLSLSLILQREFPFNVRVGFLSCLLNWNLLSGGGGGVVTGQ